MVDDSELSSTTGAVFSVLHTLAMECRLAVSIVQVEVEEEQDKTILKFEGISISVHCSVMFSSLLCVPFVCMCICLVPEKQGVYTLYIKFCCSLFFFILLTHTPNVIIFRAINENNMPL